jgi:hypothetical protein
VLKGPNELPDYVIVKDKNGGQGKGYPNPDQTFQAKFNGLLFISILLKLKQNFMDSLMIPSQANATLPLILRKIHALKNSLGGDRIFVGVKLC